MSIPTGESDGVAGAPAGAAADGGGPAQHDFRPLRTLSSGAGAEAPGDGGSLAETSFRLNYH